MQLCHWTARYVSSMLPAANVASWRVWNSQICRAATPRRACAADATFLSRKFSSGFNAHGDKALPRNNLA